MSKPFFATLLTLVVVTLVLPMPITAQEPAAGGETWSPPRTPWGDPDLQGIWTNTTTTPFERPDDLAGKAVLTEEEWAVRNPVTGSERRSPRPGLYRVLQRFLARAGATGPADVTGCRPAQWETAARDAGRAGATGQPYGFVHRGPLRLLARLQRVRPVHHPRLARFDDAWVLQPQLPDPANAGAGGDLPRNDPRRADHSG